MFIFVFLYSLTCCTRLSRKVHCILHTAHSIKTEQWTGCTAFWTLRWLHRPQILTPRSRSCWWQALTPGCNWNMWDFVWILRLTSSKVTSGHIGCIQTFQRKFMMKYSSCKFEEILSISVLLTSLISRSSIPSSIWFNRPLCALCCQERHHSAVVWLLRLSASKEICSH